MIRGKLAAVHSPLYVESSRNAVPELQKVIAVYGKQYAIQSTLAGR